MDDLVDALSNRKSGVQSDRILQAWRKALLGFRHKILGTLCRLYGVRAGELVDRDNRRRLAVQPALQVVHLRAEFNSGYVFEPDDGAVGIGAHHDLGELVFRYQTTLGDDGEGKFLPVGYRLAADLA